MMRWRAVLAGAALLAALPCCALAQGAGAAREPAQVGAASELRVTFVHSSDEHSAVLPAPFVDQGAGNARGGFARLAGAVDSLRGHYAARGEPMLLTSAGDNIAGTPFAWLVLDGLGTELGLMVDIGYDVITPGNHEWDYDSFRLARYIAAAGFPAAATRTALVATNTRAPPDHPLDQLGIRQTYMRELPNGLRIGFLGLIGRGAARFATLAAPVEFTDAHTAAAAAVRELRDAGAHMVVAVTHSGVREDHELARAVPGIDVILGGHDHYLFDEPRTEGGTIIVHPGAHTQQLFVLELGYEAGSGRVRVRNTDTGTPFVLPLDGAIAESEAVRASVERARALLDARLPHISAGRAHSVEQAVARDGFTVRARPPMQETPLGNLVTDAMRSAVHAASGEPVDFAFQANGVIRGDLPAGSASRRGDIAFYDLASVVGMGTGPEGSAGYPLVSVYLTGDEVRRVLEISVLLSQLLRNSYFLQVSGLRMRFDPDRAILFRIPFRGTPVPTGRAVLDAWRITPAGDVELARGDTALYHVVTDYYVASFLPMVGSMLPQLALLPKDRAGMPITHIDDAVVMHDGRELKVWQAVMDHLGASAAGPGTVPPRYSEAEGRLVQVAALPLWLLPLLALLALAALAGWFLARRRVRGRAPAAAPGAAPDRRAAPR